MTFALRRAGPEDVQLLVDFNRALFQFESRDPTLDLTWPDRCGHEYFREKVTSPQSAAFLALSDGKVCGYLAGGMSSAASYRIPLRLAELENMFVEPGRRGSGCGQALVGAFLAWCREQRAERVRVEASAWNAAALIFYRRAGFSDSTVSLELELP